MNNNKKTNKYNNSYYKSHKMWTDLVSQVHEKKATTAAEDWRKSVDDLASEKFVHMWKSHGVRTLTLLRRRVLTVCTGTGGNRAASAASLFSTRQRTRGRGARAFPPARRLRKRSAREASRPAVVTHPRRSRCRISRGQCTSSNAAVHSHFP